MEEKTDERHKANPTTELFIITSAPKFSFWLKFTFSFFHCLLAFFLSFFGGGWGELSFYHLNAKSR